MSIGKECVKKGNFAYPHKANLLGLLGSCPTAKFRHRSSRALWIVAEWISALRKVRHQPLAKASGM